MNLKRILLIAIPILVLALAAVRLKSNKSTAEARVYRFDKTQAIEVKTEIVKLRDLANTVSYAGTFEPYREAKISAEVSGRINAVRVEAGSEVTKGQTLIQLDNALLKLQLENVEIQIEGLESDVKRYTVLVEADAIQGVQLEKAQLALKSAKVQKATLQEQINKSAIRAPFNGIITAKLTEVGAFAAPGVPLLQITDIRHLKFTVNVPEKDLFRFKSDSTYKITADIFPQQKLTGKTSLIGSKSNMGNSFPVQFTVDNLPDNEVKSGMFGKVFLNHRGLERGFVIPASAVQTGSGKPQVYLMKNNKAVLRNVEISSRIQNKVIVAHGLKEDDRLITGGFINLFHGANVVTQ